MVKRLVFGILVIFIVLASAKLIFDRYLATNRFGRVDVEIVKTEAMDPSTSDSKVTKFYVTVPMALEGAFTLATQDKAYVGEIVVTRGISRTKINADSISKIGGKVALDVPVPNGMLATIDSVIAYWRTDKVLLRSQPVAPEQATNPNGTNGMVLFSFSRIGPSSEKCATENNQGKARFSISVPKNFFGAINHSSHYAFSIIGSQPLVRAEGRFPSKVLAVTSVSGAALLKGNVQVELPTSSVMSIFPELHSILPHFAECAPGERDQECAFNDIMDITRHRWLFLQAGLKADNPVCAGHAYRLLLVPSSANLNDVIEHDLPKL